MGHKDSLKRGEVQYLKINALEDSHFLFIEMAV